MKVRQKQWQLYYLGFLPSMDEIDGIWGPKSEAATREFQSAFGLSPVDGVFGNHIRNKSKETIAAIQDVVSPYAPSSLDKQYLGLAGARTVAATAAYQQAVGLPATGIADAVTRAKILDTVAPAPMEKTEQDSWWEDIEYFDRRELRCKCGGRYCNGYPAEPKEILVRLADRARKHFGRPATVVSGLRCARWNAIQGGVANSQHMYGEAMDIRIEGVSANRLYSFLRKQPEVRYAYMINGTNVHFDIPKGER